jgi:hypothetical protein
MNVHMLIEQLQRYDKNMEVGVQLRVSKEPEEFVAGRVTGCSQIQDIDGQKTHVVLVCEGKYPVKRTERSTGLERR